MSNYITSKDSRGNKYIEVEVQPDIESLRVTLVEKGYNNSPCLRINIRPHGKHLRMGPEFPIDFAPDLVEGLADLLKDNK